MNSNNNIAAKIRRKLQWAGNDVLHALHLKSFRSPKNPIQRILIYHGIDEKGNTKFNSRFLSVSEFKKHIEFFHQHFHVVSLDDFYKGNFHDKRSTVAITFDDGYDSNVRYAFPILREYNIPATFFITTIRDAGYEILWPDALDLSAAESDEPFELRGERFSKKGKFGYCSEKTGLPIKETCKNFGFDYKVELMQKLPGLKVVLEDAYYHAYWKLMTDDKIQQVANSGLITIGSHGYYHNCLERIPLADAQREMRLSKNHLENLLGKEVDALAFPDGNYSEEVKKAALEIGYKKLLAGDLIEGDKENDVLKSRFTINPHISTFNQMRSIIKGKY